MHESLRFESGEDEPGEHRSRLEPWGQEDHSGADGYPIYPGGEGKGGTPSEDSPESPAIGQVTPLGDLSTRLGRVASPIDGLPKSEPQPPLDPHVTDPDLVWGDEGRFNETSNGAQ